MSAGSFDRARPGDDGRFRALTDRAPTLLGMIPGEVAVLAVTPPGHGEPWAALLHDDRRRTGPLVELVEAARLLEADRSPRWVWWSAEAGAAPLVEAGIPVARAWDVAEAHRLLNGGWSATAGQCWAAAHSIPLDGVPAPPTGDLFEFAADAPATRPTRSSTPRATCAATTTSGWATPSTCTPGRGRRSRRPTCSTTPPRRPRCGWSARCWSESAAAVLCLELERDGLPVDRARRRGAHRGRRRAAPDDDADDARDPPRPRRRGAAPTRRAASAPTCATRRRCSRPARRRSGVDVPNTRTWVLEPYRTRTRSSTRCSTWRKDERIATTYGYRWLDDHVGPDDRLRGGWTACDGAAGRMTAQNGLHNLPGPAAPGRRRPHAGSRLRPRRPRPDRAAGAGRRVGRPRRSPRPPGPTTSTPRWRPAARRRPPGGQGGGARRDVRPAQRRGRRGAQGPRARLPRGDGPARAGVRRGACAASRCAPSAAGSSRSGRASSPTVPGRRRPPRYGRRAGPVRPQRGHPGRGGRAVQGVGGDGAARRRATSGPRSCCACTTSCSCTCPQEHAARGGGRGRARPRRQRPALGGRRRRCGSSPTPPSSAAGPTPRTEPRRVTADAGAAAHFARRPRACAGRRRPSSTSLRNASNSAPISSADGSSRQVGGEQAGLLATLEEGVVLLLERLARPP